MSVSRVWICSLMVLGSLLTGGQGRAQGVLIPESLMRHDPFYQVKSVKLSTRVTQKGKVNPVALEKSRIQFKKSKFLITNEQNTPGAGGGPLDIANIALKVWQIIQDNKAVLNVTRQNVKALPNLAKYDWTALTGWKPEHGVELTMSVENMYGIEVIKLTYEVALIYGGNVKGMGRYIASARVIPKDIQVLWGFSMDVNVAEVAVQNIGTEKSPMAAITLDVGVTFGSILKQESFTNSYRLQGDGLITDLTSNTRYFGPK